MMNQPDPTSQIQRYLRGELSDVEQDQFDLALMEDPELLQAVQEDAALHKGLNAEASYLRQAIQQSPTWISQAPSKFAVAALVVLSVGIAAQLPSGGNLQNTQNFSSVSELILENYRSGGQTPQQVTAAELLVMKLYLSPEADLAYEVVVQAKRTDLVIKRDATSQQDGGVIIALTQLPEGDYTVSAHSADQTVKKEFEFSVSQQG